MPSLDSHTLRLPSYRGSHLRRYHPYPRSHRWPDLFLLQVAGICDCSEVADGSEEGMSLDAPLDSTARPSERTNALRTALITIPALARSSDGHGRASLSTLIIDLALAVRRSRTEGSHNRIGDTEHILSK